MSRACIYLPACGGRRPLGNAHTGAYAWSATVIAVTVSWLTAVIDLPEPGYDLGCAFWEGVTGYGLSATRGASGGCAPLLRSDGDPYLAVQRIGAGPAGCHLDIHINDTTLTAALAVRAGARVLDESGGALVLASTGGIVFCLVDGADNKSVRPLPTRWATGHCSLVDQLCTTFPSRAATRSGRVCGATAKSPTGHASSIPAARAGVVSWDGAQRPQSPHRSQV